jgi:hypothetical protein
MIFGGYVVWCKKKKGKKEQQVVHLYTGGVFCVALDPIES